MTGEARRERQRERLAALDDLRRRKQAADMALAVMPAHALARHLSLPDVALAGRLAADRRLGRRIYWRLVDESRLPDLAGDAADKKPSLIVPPERIEEASQSIDLMLALRRHGPMIGKDDVKALARRFGDRRVKWAWSQKSIWAAPATPSSAQAATTEGRPSGSVTPLAAAKSSSDAPRKDGRALLLDHLATTVPGLDRWLDRQVNPSRSASPAAEGAIVACVVGQMAQDREATSNV